MITQTVFSSPIGNLLLERSEIGLTGLKVTDEPETLNLDPLLSEVQSQLQEYFQGERKEFNVAIDYSKLAPFSMEVLRLLRRIPYGRTRSYQDLADYLEKPKAARAIGRINGANPIAIIIPCHRVIGSNGALTGYAYGLEIKKFLLQLENSHFDFNQGELFNLTSQELSI